MANCMQITAVEEYWVHEKYTRKNFPVVHGIGEIGEKKPRVDLKVLSN